VSVCRLRPDRDPRLPGQALDVVLNPVIVNRRDLLLMECLGCSAPSAFSTDLSLAP
jgi:hypothetical protein